MFTHILDLAEGAFLMGAGIFLYLTVKKGVPWAWTTLKGWWTKGKADAAALQGRLATIEADVAALKVKVGV